MVDCISNEVVIAVDAEVILSVLTTIVEAVLDTKDVTEVFEGIIVVEGAAFINVDAMLVSRDGVLITVVSANEVVGTAELPLSD